MSPAAGFKVVLDVKCEERYHFTRILFIKDSHLWTQANRTVFPFVRGTSHNFINRCHNCIKTSLLQAYNSIHRFDNMCLDNSYHSDDEFYLGMT